MKVALILLVTLAVLVCLEASPVAADGTELGVAGDELSVVMNDDGQADQKEPAGPQGGKGGKGGKGRKGKGRKGKGCGPPGDKKEDANSDEQ
ncbi:unnamed protein product [Allacma fusca]|uniref:Glycine-rich protein n=1 Tax=Allacma fusca TaxID=39272 RepID=A0A8J2M1D9_9HEXA|nr:unnamed protein product [Allacma fusca]